MKKIHFSGCKKRINKRKDSAYVPETQQGSPIHDGNNFITPRKTSTESELDEATKLWVEGR